MKSSSTTKPWKEAQAPIMDASKSLANTYNQTAPGIQQAADSVSGLLPGMVDKYKQGDAGIDSARDYNVDVLSGNYLNNNPHLQGLIDNSNNDLRNQMQASLGSRGLTGGSSYFDILSRNIGQNTNKLRYQDYDAERGRMATAAGQSPGIAAGDAARLDPLLAAAGITTMPLQAAGEYAGGVGGLLGNYTKQTQKMGLGQMLMSGAAAAAQAYASSGSDIRLKTNIQKVGELDDGLGIYLFDYKPDLPAGIAAYCPAGRQRGVMASEVAVLRPWALGPVVDGFKTVNYGDL